MMSALPAEITRMPHLVSGLLVGQQCDCLVYLAVVTIDGGGGGSIQHSVVICFPKVIHYQYTGTKYLFFSLTYNHAIFPPPFRLPES